MADWTDEELRAIAYQRDVEAREGRRRALEAGFAGDVVARAELQARWQPYLDAVRAWRR
jgi:hypothetical protein